MTASSGCLSNKFPKHPAVWDSETEKLFSRAQWPLYAALLVRTIKACAALSYKLASALRKVPAVLIMKCLELSQA